MKKNEKVVMLVRTIYNGWDDDIEVFHNVEYGYECVKRYRRTASAVKHVYIPECALNEYYKAWAVGDDLDEEQLYYEAVDIHRNMRVELEKVWNKVYR